MKYDALNTFLNQLPIDVYALKVVASSAITIKELGGWNRKADYISSQV